MWIMEIPSFIQTNKKQICIKIVRAAFLVCVKGAHPSIHLCPHNLTDKSPLSLALPPPDLVVIYVVRQYQCVLVTAPLTLVCPKGTIYIA